MKIRTEKCRKGAEEGEGGGEEKINYDIRRFKEDPRDP